MPRFVRVSRAACVALAVMVCAAAPRSLAAQNTCLGTDTLEKEVLGLEFRGNRALSDDDLSLRVATTPSAWGRRHLGFLGTKRCFNPITLRRDLVGLRSYYKARGFYEATVDTLVQPAGKRGVRIVFNINEGQPTILADYTINGLDGVRDSADIVRRLRLHVGDRWDISLFQADLDSIVSRLRNAGYFRASVLQDSVGRDQSARTAGALLRVLPGKQARFADAEIEVTPAPDNSQQINDATVKRILGISPGQLFSDNAIRDAQRNLFQLATYRQLEVVALPDSLQPNDTTVGYRVRLTEDFMHQIDSEFGWATLDCFRTSLQYTDKNAFKTARRLEITGRATKLGYGVPFENWPTRDFCNVKLGTELGIADDQFSDSVHYFVGATLRQPRLLGTRVTPALSIYSERRGEFRAYVRTTRIGGDFSASLDVADRTPLRIGYSAEYGQTRADDAALCALFNRCDPESRRLVTGLATLGVGSLSLSRIRTDNPASPTRGSTFRAELRSAQPWLLTPDTLSFNKVTGDVAWYWPLGRSVILLRLRGGTVLGRKLEFTDKTDFIPPQERLYAGGPTSVRGFQQNELGEVVYIARPSQVTIDTTVPAPADTLFSFQAVANASPDRTVPLGGNALFVANLEYRTHLPFLFPNALQFTAFVDGGDVWSVRNTSTMKWTPGLGMRISTPVGPVQMNVAYNGYPREEAPLFYNDVSVLACATPGNTLTYRRNASGGLEQANTDQCQSYTPPIRRGINRLTLTFSIGSDF
jgi:outer membrane protein insertion porin family